MTTFEELSLSDKLAVVLLESEHPLTLTDVSHALLQRGVPTETHSLEGVWQGAGPIRQRDDGRLEMVRRGVEYAAFRRHLRHTLGFAAAPPVNNGLPTEWYSGTSDTPATPLEFEEASRLANRRLPPDFLRTLVLTWLEMSGGSGNIRSLVEQLGSSFVHQDVEAIYLCLHTTRAARTDRDTGLVTVTPGHADLLSARQRFRDWLVRLRAENLRNQVEQASARDQTRHSVAQQEAFLARRQGVVVVLFDLGAPCGGILDARTLHVDVFVPADSDRFVAALSGLQVVVGVEVREALSKLGVETGDRILIDVRVPAQYVNVGRHRRRLNLEDAITFTVGSESLVNLPEVWRHAPQHWTERVTQQLRLLERWYTYGRGHGYVLSGSHASQTVPVAWNPGGLPTLSELTAEALDSEDPVEVSLRARPHVFRPAVVQGGHLWWLDTGWVEPLDATRLFAMRRPQPLGDDGTEPFSMVVLRVQPETVVGVRMRDQRRVELHPMQCGEGLVEGEVMDITPVALEDHGRYVAVEGRALGRGWSLSHLHVGPSPGDDPSLTLERARDDAEAGRPGAAAAALSHLLQNDFRCLDAHAHVGSLWFNHGGPHGANLARKRYELGTRIGLPADFKGLLPWSQPANRPLLRCLYGWGLALWRLGQFAAAADAFTRLLALNPTDEQGVHLVMPLLSARIPWYPEGEEWV